MQFSQTITAKSHCDLKLAHKKLQIFWPAVMNRKRSIPIQDNTRHTSQTTTSNLLKWCLLKVVFEPCYVIKFDSKWSIIWFQHDKS